MQWEHYPPRAPHWGGAIEAMVKLTKAALKATIGEQLITDMEMVSVLTAVENTLNKRPIGSLSGDPNDEASLTPFHFLCGHQPIEGLVPFFPGCRARYQRLYDLMGESCREVWDKLRVKEMQEQTRKEADNFLAIIEQQQKDDAQTKRTEEAKRRAIYANS